ncbi:hypothetical protein [Serratia fonticola]|uniref:hypothetical protein n=1 Tax=Serratia fonticola TaxID=47917 RepID=UPI0034C6B182
MKDIIVLLVVGIVCFLLIVARLRSGITLKNTPFYCLCVSFISILEITNAIYVPYSYRHNALYNNDEWFPYDYYYIATWGVALATAFFLLVHSFLTRKSSR